MRMTMNSLVVLALVLGVAASASAQAAGNWQDIHGQVQAVNGNQLSLKSDDGRVIDVDMSQVSASVRGAMAPNVGVTVTGFPATSGTRFTARYIVQDKPGPAPATAGSTIERVLPLVPQFAVSQEFRDRAAGLDNERGAHSFATRLYRGFLEREPNDSERNYWAGHLLRSRDVRGTVEAFMKSPEYAGKNKNDRQAITDLYEVFFGRPPSAEEIRTWEGRIVQR
jgi:uncharacterized protein DUF4214